MSDGTWQHYVGEILRGVVVTLELSAISVVAALALGVVGALLRIHGPKPVRALIVCYVELIRGLPPILQIFVLYYGLAEWGIELTSWNAALTWLIAYGTGYAIELFRAGLVDIDKGQYEASAALNLGPTTTFVRVIVPQASRVMLPPLTSFVVGQVKNTSLLYYIGVADIMFQAQLSFNSAGDPMLMFGTAALMYIVICGAIGRAGLYLERRFALAR